MKNKEIAVINWTDAAMHGTSGYSEDELKNIGLVHGIAVGIIVKEDDTSITLAMDWFYSTGQFRNLSTYPKSGISSIIKKTLKKVKQ